MWPAQTPLRTQERTHAFTFILKSKSVPIVWQTFWWCMVGYLVPKIRIRIAPETKFRVAVVVVVVISTKIIGISSIIAVAIAMSMFLARKWNILSGGNSSEVPSSTQCTYSMYYCSMLHSVLGRRNNGMAYSCYLFYITIALCACNFSRCKAQRSHIHTHICCNRMRMRPYTEFSSVNCIRCIDDKTGVDRNAIANCHLVFFASRNGFSGFMYSIHIHANRHAY